MFYGYTVGSISRIVPYKMPKSGTSTNNCRPGAKGDWDFRISDLVKNPDGTDI